MSQGYANPSLSAPGWSDWSPSYSGITIGSGTVTARYIQIGTLVVMRWHWVLAGDSSVSSTPSITVPVAANSTGYFANSGSLGVAAFLDSGTNTFFGRVLFGTGHDDVILRVNEENGADISDGVISSTNPFTFTTNDGIFFTATYEASSPAVSTLELGHFHSGYNYGESIYYTADGSFAKADYPGMRAVLVKCQGAGGGGGGTGTTTGSGLNGGQGGGGGGYSEAFVLVGDLSASESIVAGTGGSGGTADGSGGTEDGSDGEDSSFGTHCVAEGGYGGAGDISNTNNTIQASTSTGGLANNGTGDLTIGGGPGGMAYGMHDGSTLHSVYGGVGGDAHLGGGGAQVGAYSSAAAGNSGDKYGGGGSGAASGDVAGGAGGGGGANGIVIVEVYY